MGEREPEPSRSGGAPREGTRARRIALEIILESDGGRNAFIDEVLEARLAREEISDKDRRLLQEIAYGAVRHRNSLDHILDSYVRFAMKRQRPPVRWALRLAAYQVIYLSRIPFHAAIDHTIDALKKLPETSEREAGFLNAVLRKLAGDIVRKSEGPPLDPHDPTAIPIREGSCHFNRPVLPLRNLDLVGHIALKHSHPRWMVARWLERFGEEGTVSLCVADNRIPPLAARITARAPGRGAVLESLRAQGVEAEPLGETGSLVLRRTGDPRKIECLGNGWIQIQDPTATAIGAALAPPAGARALDLCAAPGGKASEILEAVGPGGSLVACDVDEGKLERLKETLDRIGGSFSVVKVPAEPEAIDLGERFSHILLDAPCSNTGVLARRPEARFRVHEEDIPKLAELERRLLAAAVRHLAPGGRLVYSTCSIEPEEDEGVVARALLEHPDLRKTAERFFLPGRDPGDGGYYAVLERSA